MNCKPYHTRITIIIAVEMETYITSVIYTLHYFILTYSLFIYEFSTENNCNFKFINI